MERLAKAGLLHLVTEKFANIDLHPDAVDNAAMGAVLEEQIREFAEISNETVGAHFTPREAIRLVANLLFIEDGNAYTLVTALRSPVAREVYKPTIAHDALFSGKLS